MGRPAQGWWHRRKGCYVAKLGPVNPRTGKPSLAILRDEHGRPITRSDHKGRLAAIARLLGERQACAWVGPTVRDVCAGFVAWSKAEGRARTTYEGHDSNLTRWARLIGPDRPAASIGPADVWAWADAGHGHYRQVVQSVKAAWAWASRPIRGRVPVRLLEVDPLRGLTVPPSRPQQGKALPWRLTRRILRLAWAFAREPARTRHEHTRDSRRLRWLCLAVIAWTGLRPREAWGMRWDEWDAQSSCFLPAPARVKTRRFRAAPVPERLGQIVEGLRSRADPTYVFRARGSLSKGEPAVSELWRWLREDLQPWLARQAELPPWTCYSLRHGWFTDAVAGGLDADRAAIAGANSAPVVRSRYLDVQLAQVRETMRLLWASRRRGVGR